MDDKAVMYSIGFLEGLINWAETAGANNIEAARGHLKIVEDAFIEQTRKLKAYTERTDEICKIIRGS